MKTMIPSLPGIEREWHVIDADGAVLGRVASKAALILMGKHKPLYTPFLDTGDHVVVVNGYDDSGVYISDPAKGTYGFYDWDTFMWMWNVLDGMSLGVAHM